MPVLADFEVDLLEPVVGQLEEDPEVVAGPLDEAVEPLDALAEQALGVAELGDGGVEVFGEFLGRGVAGRGFLGQAAGQDLGQIAR